MKLAYFDCFAGAAGDMIVGALLDAGADAETLRAGLASLAGGIGIRCEAVQRGGIAGTMFHVQQSGDSPHRGLADILAMIDSADLPGRVAERAKAIFTRLGQVESQIHQVDLKHVHFHEVGAVDSIADIVGACLALESLGVDRIVCSAIPVGSGTVTCDHGQFPLPAPATAALLAGVPTKPGPNEGEATTPTAAAILTTLADTFGQTPAMTVDAIGYGAGTREGDAVPNLLRVFLGEASEDGSADTVVELSANIDDCTGEIIGAAIDKLLAAGCVDAWAAPIVMKKSRPAWMLSALCTEADVAAVEEIFFRETTTFGVRRRHCARRKLDRRYETVETPYGPIRIKLGLLEGRIVTASPEFADCAASADTHHVPVREVLASATAAYRRETDAT